MSSETLQSIGPGKGLAYLRGALTNARRSLLIVGPWIDSFFATELVKASPDRLDVRVILRPENQVEDDVWEEMLAALRIFSEHWSHVEARTLERLHAKCLVIDNEIAFLGSMNWYRYSLESQCELLVRAPVQAIAGLPESIENLWEQAFAVEVAGKVGENKAKVSPGIERDLEALDPLAREAMKQNLKSMGSA